MSRIVDEAERALGKTRCFGFGKLEGVCVNTATPGSPWCVSCDTMRKETIDGSLRQINERFDEIFAAMQKTNVRRRA